MSNAERLCAELLGLVEKLRRAGYNIGTQQHIDAQHLLLHLALHGQLPEQPRQLKLLLAPLLCRSPQQQSEFDSHFETWARQVGPLRKLTFARSPTGARPETSRQHPIEPTESGSKHSPNSLSYLWNKLASYPGLKLLLAGMMGIVLLSGLWRYTALMPPENMAVHQNTPQKLVTPVSTTSAVDVIWYVEMILLFFSAGSGLAIGLIFWQRTRMDGFLARQAARVRPNLESFFAKGMDTDIFQSLTLARSAHRLRRHEERPSTRLDIPATLEKTIRRAGWFTPVPGTLKQTPEYLALIDRAAFLDHQAQFAEALLHQLENEGVALTCYWFDGDPRYCYPQAHQLKVYSLGELLERHGGQHLLIFSDGTGLFDPVTGKPVQWLRQLHAWGQPTLFTLGTPWQIRRQALLAENFLVFPASEKGLAAFAVFLETRNVVDIDHAPDMLPVMLQELPGQWLARRAPAPVLVAELLEQLKDFLGTEGFAWLAACAVYPEVRWPLTLYLGYRLFRGDTDFLKPHLERLASLPWLRHGYLPDWLRLALLTELREIEATRESNVRQALTELLRSTANVSGENKLELELAQPPDEKWQKRLLQYLRIQEAEDSPLRDYVFLAFMENRLSIHLPQEFRELLHQLREEKKYLNPKIEILQPIVSNSFRDTLKDGTSGPEMIYLPGGTFKMGDKENGPIHSVILSAFSIGKYPVTVGDFWRFVDSTGYRTETESGNGAIILPSHENKKDIDWRNPYFEQDNKHPVVFVSWSDAQAYCQWLKEQTGQNYRLLTEAQWEYACRAGTNTSYCFGDEGGQLGEYGWYEKNSGNRTHPVGGKKANQWGLHDLHGNVWEWVEDCYSKSI